MILDKYETRKALLNKRNLLELYEIKEYSELICTKIKQLQQYKQANTVFAYIDAKNEVATFSLIQDDIDEGKTVCLPLTIKNSVELEFYRVFDLDKDLQKGYYGILEPIPNVERIVLPEDADLIIVPGVAFDLNLNRIGYGKGYYDRFLSKVSKNVPKIALAYDFQVLESISEGENDIKMDMIITEKRIIIR